jgi:hypothetical protein
MPFWQNPTDVEGLGGEMREEDGVDGENVE